MKRRSTTTPSSSLRCAVYTRKSSEEGLEQSFNSLHAQREACEAYIVSQKGEGWQLLPTAYDDGGYSGGNMDRPGLVQLLADVDVGKVDIIVVYKVDRLTRSLMDFARIVEKLDAKGICFVSVTQAFNTTTSMGRLTLNVLLSFAQFEREVTGERIRDKIAASKAKGMWMGGMVPLGYDVFDRQLVVNAAEAERVRYIYARYLELGSVPRLAQDLQNNNMRSKSWTSRKGRAMGNARLSCGALYHMLQNRLYLGEIVHRDDVHAGQHDPIIDRLLFEAVQAKLNANRRQHRARPTRAASCPLTGILYDAEDVPMSPSFGYGRGKRIYRYYVSASVLPGRNQRPCRSDIIRRVPAPAIEALVTRSAARLLASERYADWAHCHQHLRRVEIRDESIHLLFESTSLREPHEKDAVLTARLQGRIPIGDSIAIDTDGRVRLICDRRGVFRGGRQWRQSGETGSGKRADPALATLLKSAHHLLAEHRASPLEPDNHCHATPASSQRKRRIMAVGLLAPGIQRAMLEGRAPPCLTADMLLQQDLPLDWGEQRKVLGFTG